MTFTDALLKVPLLGIDIIVIITTILKVREV